VGPLEVLLTYGQDIKIQVKDISIGRNPNITEKSHATIFHELLNAQVPGSERRPDQIWQEDFLVIGAGTETTAWSRLAPRNTLPVPAFVIFVSSAIDTHY
jgi:hypothetical protein